MWAGRETVTHTLRLIEHLWIMPQSRIWALEQGDIEFMGWDTKTTILASHHNLFVQLLAGLSKDMDAESLMIRIPGEPEPESELTFPTLAAFATQLETGGPATQFLRG